MVIFGKSLSEYVEFCWVFLILIALAGVTRLTLSMSGTPNSTAKWFSMTVLVFIGALYYAMRVHAAGFGSYKQLLIICILMNVAMQVISIGAILISIQTGRDNIFSVPEYAFGSDNKWLHVVLHVTVGLTIGALVPWLVGSGVLALTRKIAPPAVAESRRTP